MKLRNKKTGEIVNIDFIYPETAEYFKPNYLLADFTKEWEDVEEPKIIEDWECSYMSNDFREGYYILTKVSNREIE